MSPVDPKVSRHIDIESPRAYRAMYPRRLTVAWTFALVAAIVLYSITWLGELFPYDRPTVIAIVIGLFLWAIYRQLLMPSLWAMRYRGWRSRLPFTLNGWSEALSDSRLLNHKYWCDLTITVAPSVTSPDLESAIDAALMLFGRKAWDAYYSADSNTGSRLHWKSSAFHAEGSANNRVFGLILELLTGPLSRIAMTSDAKLVVTITPTKEFYFVKSDPFAGGIGVVP